MMHFHSIHDHGQLFTEKETYPALVTFICVRLAFSFKKFCEFFIPLLVSPY